MAKTSVRRVAFVGMRAIGIEERRARLGVRHHLAAKGDSVESIAEDLVGLHSSDPAAVFLSARARVDAFAPGDLEAALYERRSLVRILGMRRTMFVVPTHLAAVIDSACTKVLVPPERRRLIKALEEQGIARDGGAWIERVSDLVLDTLAREGELTAVELTRRVPGLSAKLRFGEGKSWGGDFGVSTRLLFLLAGEGRVVRARPRGSWISGQYRWAATNTWLGRPLDAIDRLAASVQLLGRWLRTFGPATLTDIRWWTGWTLAHTRASLAELATAEVALDEGTGFVLADDLEPVRAAEPWVRLLPSLDPTIMGWKERDWYLGPHALALFDRNGNAGPTVWVDGRAVGAWSHAEDGTIAVRLLERLGRTSTALLKKEQRALAEWLGDVRIIPRFRTALEQELRGH